MSFDKPTDYFEIHSHNGTSYVYAGTVTAGNAEEAMAIFKKKHEGDKVAEKIKAKQMKKFPKLADKFRSKK